MTSKGRRSKSTEDLNEISDSVFDNLMKCPIKRQLVLQIISSEKDNIDKFKRKQAEEEKRKRCNASPLTKIQRKYQCESPTALLRRRALEQRNRQSNFFHNSSDDGESSSSSKESTASSNSSSIPFNKLLDGVIAYVEIKSNAQDRSDGAKALLHSMGASVRDQFTNDVTHVIFKDGSFKTYQKAKLKKVHLVSVLWVEAVRRSNARVSERNFPAFGTEAYDHNVSSLCSQIQKDYEEILKDEVRRSLVTGTPLPSMKSLIHRRKTMTPTLSTLKMNSQIASSQDSEVAKIISFGRKPYEIDKEPDKLKMSPELTSDDDSELGPLIDGAIIQRKKDVSRYQNVMNSLESEKDFRKSDNCNSKTSKSVLCETSHQSKMCGSSMDLTSLDGRLIIEESVNINEKENNISDSANNSIYTKKTPRKKPKHRSSEVEQSEDDLFNIPDGELYKRRTRRIRASSNRKSINDSPLENKSSAASSKMSLLQLSHPPEDLHIISKNICSPCINTLATKDSPRKETDAVVEKSSSTIMSSLQISSDSSKEKNKEKSTSMSTLQISASSKGKTNSIQQDDMENNNNKVLKINLIKNDSIVKGDFNSSVDNSFSPLKPDVVKGVLQILDKSPLPDRNVTRRRGTRSTTVITRYNTRRNTLALLDDTLSSSRESKSKASLGKSSHLDKLKNNSISEDDFHITEITDDTPKKTSKMSPQNSQGNTESSGSGKRNRRRKLYNPDDSLKETVTNDENERKNKREAVKRRKSDEGVILYPNSVGVTPSILLITKAKQLIDKNNLDIEAVLNKESGESEEKKGLNKRRKKKKQQEQIEFDSEADEQQALADEFINKKNATKSNKKSLKEGVKSGGSIIKRRQSARLSQFPRKKLDLNTSSSDNDDKKPSVSVTNRRSTMEFQTAAQMSVKKKLKIDKNKRPSIVCTKLHKGDIQIFNQIVRKLGGFVIEDEVSIKTTHLVAGESKRTINMLRAIAMGCWVLRYEWVLKSLEEGKWLPEEDYEVLNFSPSVQQCRLQRQAFGPSYSMDIFQDCGPIYIATGTIPRCSDLRELVSLCKGKVVTILRSAEIVVGEFVRHAGVNCVTEAWVLDSITFNRKMPFKKYIIPAV